MDDMIRNIFKQTRNCKPKWFIRLTLKLSTYKNMSILNRLFFHCGKVSPMLWIWVGPVTACINYANLLIGAVHYRIDVFSQSRWK